jgi:hypothetical protein
VKPKKAVTYKVHGTFKCEFQMDNPYFPYHTISSALKVRVREQYYDSILVRYNMLFFPEGFWQIYTQFGFQFLTLDHLKFGIYKTNCCDGSYELSAVTEQIELLEYDELRRSYVESGEIFERTKQLEFKFELYSFNTPFVLRNLVPQLVLGFVSLMAFYEDTDVYPNAILLAVTLLQLLSNFRTSKYDSSSFNIFQVNILVIVLVNFLLLIVGTHNLYTEEADEPYINTKHWLF